MFVKQVFEDLERIDGKKKGNFNKTCCCRNQLTAIMKADGFTCTTPLHERSRSAGTY